MKLGVDTSYELGRYERGAGSNSFEGLERAASAICLVQELEHGGRNPGQRVDTLLLDQRERLRRVPLEQEHDLPARNRVRDQEGVETTHMEQRKCQQGGG